MATWVTWLGEGVGSPPSTQWRGIVFALGEAVEVSDPALIAKAAGNRFFLVKEEHANVPVKEVPVIEPLLEEPDEDEDLPLPPLRSIAVSDDPKRTPMTKRKTKVKHGHR